MENFIWSSKKKDNKLGILISLFLLFIFFVGKAVIESGHILFYIVCLLFGISAYYLLNFLHGKILKKPASLGIYSKKYPIIIQYNPPKGINPAEAGLLYNCSVEPTDLTSLIYQWKFEKLIDIKIFKGKNSGKDCVKLVKLEDLPLSRPLFESEIFDSIFRMGNVKIIEGSFQLRYALMLEDLEYYGIQKGWVMFNESKKKSNNKSNGNDVGPGSYFFLLYFLFSFISIILETLGISTNISIDFSKFLWGLFIIFGIWILIVLLCGKMDGRSNLKFTDKGAELAAKVIGYSEFIKSCDENKIKLLLKEDPLFIDRTLPYATAFGMETEFLKKVSPLKEDWNAKYVRGHKVPSWIGILRMFLKSDNDSLL